MAVGGSANITVEDVQDGDGTLYKAFEVWASRKGPEQGEGRAQTQVRIQRLYIEIQEELFGPDFRTQAVRASPAAVADQPPNPGEGVEL
eukprot:12410090-Karenia_brevis.AAC.1